MIFEGLRLVTPQGSGRLGVLVDERFGSAVAKSARRDGVLLAMPIEVSGASTFEFEYGDAFAEHVAAFDPDFVKVLVRQNPADPPAERDVQIGWLGTVSDWVASQGRRWLFELVVPPYARAAPICRRPGRLRPGRAAGTDGRDDHRIHTGDVHPSIWKLDGYDTSAGSDLVLAAVAADIELPARCIVLGRDAPLPRVERWLRLAAQSPLALAIPHSAE